VFQINVRRIFGYKEEAESDKRRKARDENVYTFISEDIE
jgi:hypothetical protein